MGRVAGVFDNPPGFPCTPPGVKILEGGKLTVVYVVNVVYLTASPRMQCYVESGSVPD